MNQAAQIEKAIAANRKKQADCEASLARYRDAARAAVDNAAAFMRASGRATNEERRLAIFKEEEAALESRLGPARKADEMEEHWQAVVAYDRESSALASKWKRAHEEHARPLAEAAKLLDANDRLGGQLREAAKRLGSQHFPGPPAESIARPSTTERYVVHQIVGDFDASVGPTERNNGPKIRRERHVQRGPIRHRLNIPSFDDGAPLYEGEEIRRSTRDNHRKAEAARAGKRERPL